MKVYFYHTQDIQRILKDMEDGGFPSHFLYGAAHLGDNGVEVVWHRSRAGLPRWLAMLRTAWLVLTSRERFDAIYATHYQGLELIIMLRALRLYRRPLVIWHHQPVINSASWWRERLGRLFYRGFDRIIFFSRELLEKSVATQKIPPERAVLGHWGADLGFYDKILSARQEAGAGCVSTGKELRDMPTLVAAFNRAGVPLDIYVGRKTGGVDYEEVFSGLCLKPNVRLHYIEGLRPCTLAKKVAESACVVICCLRTNYTVGLTTLVEALALGKPVICSRNPNFPVDVERAGCGISVAYGDVEGWTRAVRYIAEHPAEAREMGRRGRAVAERTFNDERCAEEAAAAIKAAAEIPTKP